MNATQSLAGRSLALIVGVGSIVAVSGQAIAADRGHGRGDHHSSGHSGVRVGIGFSTCGSGFSIGVGNGWYGRGCAPAYCAPRYYGSYYRYPSTVVVASPYYGYSAYDYPRTVVVQPPVVTQPTIVTQPVVVQQPVTIAAAPPTQAAAYPAEQAAPVQASAAPSQPQQQQEAEQNRYHDRELGDAYMRMHDPENAARVYKRYLSAWNGDGTVTRNYGLAQIARGETQDGFRSVIQGYKLESGLIKRPIRIDDLGGKIGFERILDAASRGAAGTNSAEGWATVALLQNASGNREAAINALQHARDAGLEQSVLDQFTLEIGKPTS